jgi:thymidine kinase
MPIKSINEIENPNKQLMIPIKEKQDIYSPDIVDKNISRRNGMMYLLTGSGGSGKSSLLLNMFKNKNMYRNKFQNIYYFCPEASFISVEKHPFENHDKVYHELSVAHLEMIYQELLSKKTEVIVSENDKKTKKKKKKKAKFEGEEEDLSEKEEVKEVKELEYSCIIIDDFANNLKDKDLIKQLNKMIIKARHILCSFIFTTQSYFYLEKVIRKQLTYVTIFQPKNVEEWNSIAKELFNMNKEDALTLYNYVFDEPYNHIDADLVMNKYYKNFNYLEINS